MSLHAAAAEWHKPLGQTKSAKYVQQHHVSSFDALKHRGCCLGFQVHTLRRKIQTMPRLLPNEVSAASYINLRDVGLYLSRA